MASDLCLLGLTRLCLLESSGAPPSGPGHTTQDLPPLGYNTALTVPKGVTGAVQRGRERAGSAFGSKSPPCPSEW